MSKIGGKLDLVKSGTSLPEKRSFNVLEDQDVDKDTEIKEGISSNKSMVTFSKVQNLQLFIGAHVSAAKGVENSILNSIDINGNAFALFLKSQRKWISPCLKPYNIQEFRKLCSNHGFDPKKHILPHGSYLVNLASADKEKRDRSYENLIDDVKRCQQLGIGKINFHPGSCGTSSRISGINNLADCINKAHKDVSDVMLVIENMAGQGNTLGTSFEELSTILSKVEDKSRIGICLDTCHLFASGYDIRNKDSYNNVMNQFENKIGFQYLVGVHLNDSKTPLGSRRDLHANIGRGYIGLEAFRLLINDKRMQGIPLILETPTNDDSKVWQEEIELLRWLYGKESDDAELSAKSNELKQLAKNEHLNNLKIDKNSKKIKKIKK
ncbi:hypothetical protein T552_01418 [Pneumocystis carinii B80]|uniref:Apurinic-apyrimidinic endonuclease 1 n=1 Tax=Pneumocystis carinii (strain B80) TaxID=1408658 RepID=A0A0W4ZK79_PNEC8|nr:hypothetical protein T552_01418 [Pneumocystis carinii B80]KTW28788.1 hypothetical protein T552_01418 [Pneumocystis carinii B80]